MELLKIGLKKQSTSDENASGLLHGDAADRLRSDGYRFFVVFELEQDEESIRNAIDAFKEAAACVSESADDPRLAASLVYVSIAYQKRYARFGRIDDLREAIRQGQIALGVSVKSLPSFPACLHNLGTAFTHRFEYSAALDDISEAIQNLQRAIQFTHAKDANLPQRLNDLGIAFLSRFAHTGDLDDITKAIENVRHAIQLTPHGDADLPVWFNNLGNAFSSRFDCTGDLDDISQAFQNQQHAPQLLSGPAHCMPICQPASTAIQNLQLAIQLTPDDHADLPVRLSNLGTAFLRRFERTGDLDDISQAIKHQQRAIYLIPEGHSHLAGQLNNLGNELLHRFERAGDPDDIFQAIQNLQDAIRLTPDRHADLPVRLNNLGNALLRRFKHTGDVDVISQAINYLERAVHLTPDKHSGFPARLHDLGSALVTRFECTARLDDITEAIQNLRNAVELTPKGHNRLPARLRILGNTLFSRYKHTKTRDDFSQAVQLLMRAVKLIPEGHPHRPSYFIDIANMASLHFKRSKDYESLSSVVTVYRFAAMSRDGPPSVCLIAAQHWARLSCHPPFLSQLLDAHGRVIQLLSLVSSLETTIQRRHETLVGLSQSTIAAAFSLGRPDKALEWLIEGRCIVWNQINQLRTPVDELRDQCPALAEQFSIVSMDLENAGSRTKSGNAESFSMDCKVSLAEQASKHVRLAKEWDDLLAIIRNTTGFDDFLRPRRCADIMRSLPDEGAIVIINVHPDRCDALALMDGTSMPIHVPLPKFSYERADRLAQGLRHHLLCNGIRLGIPLTLDPDDSPFPDFGLAEVLEVLWSDVVFPILDALAFTRLSDSEEKLPRLWWCPTGPLAFLPIHAAGIYDSIEGKPKQCLSDLAVSSYIPTLNTLLKTSSDSVKKTGNIPVGLLILSQPNTPGMSPIPYAAVEAEKINSLLHDHGILSHTLNGQEGTVNGLLEAMESVPCIHLACHAFQDMQNPLKSSIYLHDGRLELSEIVKKSLPHSEFAFLSACQTSKGDKNLPEEVVHLAAGMLSAGYRSVVGTMWSMEDLLGPDLAEFFYERLLNDGMSKGDSSEFKIDGAGAARALHHAIQRLREKVSDSPLSLLAWVPYIHIGI